MNLEIHNEDPTVADLDIAIAKQQEEKKTSAVGYILLCLLLPPVTPLIAIFIAWRKGILKQILPSLIIVVSLLTLLISFSQFYTIKIPQIINQLGANLQEVTYSQNLKLLTYLLMIIGLFGLVIGIYLRLRLGKIGTLNNFMVWLLLGLIIFQTILAIYIFYIMSSSLTSSVAPVFQGF